MYNWCRIQCFPEGIKKTLRHKTSINLKSTAGKAQEPTMPKHLYISNGSKVKPQILVTKQKNKFRVMVNNKGFLRLFQHYELSILNSQAISYPNSTWIFETFSGWLDNYYLNISFSLWNAAVSISVKSMDACIKNLFKCRWMTCKLKTWVKEERHNVVLIEIWRRKIFWM